jgi:tripartite-type tricarboxylate transporter receptor subunit TctC
MYNKRNLMRSAVISLGLGVVCAGLVQAQAKYPERPIKLVVPWSAGGPVDVGSRVIATALSTRLGQPVIVENRLGASGMIGAEAAGKSANDGYTLFVGNVDTNVINPHVFPNIRYKAQEDFEPVIELGRLPLAIAARADFVPKSIDELVQAAKKSPSTVRYGSWGIASLGHIALAMIEQSGGVEMLHVPYQGGAPAQAALLGGQLDLLVMQVPAAINFAKAEKVKILGLTAAQRTPLFPEIPTVAEQGFKDYAAEQWVGFYVSKGTPSNVRDQLNREINELLKQPQILQSLRDVGYEVTGGTANQLVQRQFMDTQRWGKVIRDRKITAAL